MHILKLLRKMKEATVDWVVLDIRCLRYELEYVRWYLKPLWIFGHFLDLIHNIGRFQIRIWPRKFKDWDYFELHLEKIFDVLRKNNELDWVDRINDAKTISQSSLEILFALTDELKQLRYSALSKQLGIRKDVKKAIAYLNSFKRD